MTADADFAAMAGAVPGADIGLVEFSTQGGFLIDNWLREILMVLNESGAVSASATGAEGKKLIVPWAMVERVEVLALTRRDGPQVFARVSFEGAG